MHSREIQAPAYSQPVPMREPTLPFTPEKLELAFTKKQREWYLRVFTNDHGFPQCAFQKYSERYGWYRCGNTKDLQIHHIIPDAWTRAQEPDRDPNAISTTYGICLCKRCHTDTIHPDIGEAIRNYYSDPTAIKRAVGEHKYMAARGLVFWEDSYDQMMWDIAEQAVTRYMSLHPYDKYPKDKKWEKEHTTIPLQTLYERTRTHHQ